MYKSNRLTCIMPYSLFSDSISNTHSHAMYTRRTLFCGTLKGATFSYPQGCKAGGFLFFFLLLFLLFSQIWGHSWCFPPEKSEIRTLFHDFNTRISLNSSEKGGKEKNTGGRITAPLSLTPEPVIFPEPKDGNLRRRGFQRYI